MLFYHTFTPLQDISVRVNLTFTGLGETLSLPVGWRGSAGYGNTYDRLCVTVTFLLYQTANNLINKTTLLTLNGINRVVYFTYYNLLSFSAVMQ